MFIFVVRWLLTGGSAFVHTHLARTLGMCILLYVSWCIIVVTWLPIGRGVFVPTHLARAPCVHMVYIKFYCLRGTDRLWCICTYTPGKGSRYMYVYINIYHGAYLLSHGYQQVVVSLYTMHIERTPGICIHVYIYHGVYLLPHDYR